MKQRYLEVTFRKGKPLTAYLYLPRPTGTRGGKRRAADRLRLVDVLGQIFDG